MLKMVVKEVKAPSALGKAAEITPTKKITADIQPILCSSIFFTSPSPRAGTRPLIPSPPGKKKKTITNVQNSTR